MGSANPNALFDVMANKYRRRLLCRLIEAQTANEVVYVPGEIHTGEKELQELLTECVHVHLPMMEDLGYIERVDAGDKVAVSHGRRFSRIEPCVELLYENRDRMFDQWD